MRTLVLTGARRTRLASTTLAAGLLTGTRGAGTTLTAAATLAALTLTGARRTGTTLTGAMPLTTAVLTAALTALETIAMLGTLETIPALGTLTTSGTRLGARGRTVVLTGARRGRTRARNRTGLALGAMRLRSLLTVAALRPRHGGGRRTMRARTRRGRSRRTGGLGRSRATLTATLAAVAALLREGGLEFASHRRLNRGGGGLDELPHILQLLQRGLAVDAEFLGNFINAWFRHYLFSYP